MQVEGFRGLFMCVNLLVQYEVLSVFHGQSENPKLQGQTWLVFRACGEWLDQDFQVRRLGHEENLRLVCRFLRSYDGFDFW